MKQEAHWLKTMGSSLEWEISPVWQKQKRNSVIRQIPGGKVYDET